LRKIKNVAIFVSMIYNLEEEREEKKNREKGSSSYRYLVWGERRERKKECGRERKREERE
jgi:hypothetical protein